MIAKIQNSFSSDTTLKEKIDYHISKMNAGKASFLYDNSYLNDINLLHDEMKNIGSLNDQVKQKFTEISLNLQPGENISDDAFLEIAKEYMEKMGYDESCYNIWRHFDKEHSHVHILLTTVDYSGKWIDDSYSKRRSQKLSRDLEVKYGLKQVVYNKFKNEPLSQVKAREYYFDNALKKGLRGYNTKEELQKCLPKEDLAVIQRNKLTNNELQILLGDELYSKVGSILEANKLFSKLYKDELLVALDDIYKCSTSKEDFFKKIEEAGLYVRMVSDKGVHSYIYGIPDASIYFKDKQLPLTYRYENISVFGKREPRELLESEQKNRIYNKAFIALKKSKDFDEYKSELQKKGITLNINKNSNGVYGLSMQLEGIKNPIIFKASSISRKLSFKSLDEYFKGKDDSIPVWVQQTPVFIKELENTEMRYEGISRMPGIGGDRAEDFLSFKNQKKKRKKGRRDYDI